ncbi:glutamate--tRNA ligase [Rickettsiella endosymbiont of Miltochrista miniata]|uniref:glutamate--tRNA ligase n=1 Tax=Rickettsiella endosymbiont of Miltochrista miniata TaxID=3066239 RepID=UPI00313F0C4E
MKTRFAPSPTGHIHLGNARTALFNFLLAHSKAGCFLLRIEDSDATRSLLTLAKELEEDLLWLGLPWQEGPSQEKGLGPYYQSQRQAIYTLYYEQLVSIGRAYPCFCSESELLMMRKRQLALGKPPRYSGHCRQLTAEQVAEKKAQGLLASLRFHVLPKQEICFDDFVKGKQSFATEDIGDFVIQRSDGSAAFFFCNAIDDALMKVTHVLRGEDHLTNTPRQIMLLQALSLNIPAYGHMALIVGDDGAPLSKRHGSFSIKSLREAGYFAEALQNYLARVGHTYTNPNFLDIHALAEQFSPSRLGKSPARYDQTQLLYWQKQVLLHISNDKLIEWLDAKIQNLVPSDVKLDFIELMRGTICFPDEAVEWATILFSEAGALNFSIETKIFLRKVDPRYWQTLLDLLEKGNADFKVLIKQLQERLNLKGKALFAPLRLSLTGRHDGPELAKLFTLLGNEKIRERILHAKNL